MNFYIALVVLLFVFVCVFGFRCYCTRIPELFSAEFVDASPSIEFLEYFDMGDHKTMVQSQRGNSGRTVLLLHNSPMNLNVWQPLFQTMQRMNMTGLKTPSLFAYDLRGHGTAWEAVDPAYNDSDIYNQAWTIDGFVNDCKRVYDRFIGTGKVMLCGFGFGGSVAQKVALTYPEIVEKLVILQTTIRPMPGLGGEINYLANWVEKNPNVTYLTSEESFNQEILCAWFYLPRETQCPPDKLIKKEVDVNDQKDPQYDLATRMVRQGSSTSLLQTNKILAVMDLVDDWQEAGNIPFTIHILAATEDPYAPPDMMVATYTAIYNTNRSVTVALDIVTGRHGFTIMRPDYIAGIVCDDCRRLREEQEQSSEAEGEDVGAF